MKKLLLKISAIFVLVLITSIGIDAYYRSLDDLKYPLPTHILPMPEIKDRYEIVKLGNSHAEDGITFEKYNLKGLDLTGSGQELGYDLAFLKQYARQIKEGAVILITVSPISFSQKKASVSTGLQRLYYGRISPVFIPSLDLGEYLQNQFLPFLRSGYLLRDRHYKQVLQRISDEQGAIHQEVVTVTAPQENSEQTPILVVDQVQSTEIINHYFSVDAIQAEVASPSAGTPDKLNESMHFMFRKWYNLEEFSLEFAPENRADLEAIIAYCYKNSWQPVLITVPISAVLEDGLADDYKQLYLYDQLAQTDLQGAEYFDFTLGETPKSNSNFYSNSDHLNEDGAAVFSYLLLRRLIDEGYVSAEADGYDYLK